MQILYWLESIRNPVMDTLMLILTEFGNELLFIVFGMLMLWCLDKRQGYYVLLVGFFGIYINQFLKITCRIPRPWDLDPSFSIVEAARATPSPAGTPRSRWAAMQGLPSAAASGGYARSVSLLRSSFPLPVCTSACTPRWT